MKTFMKIGLSVIFAGISLISCKDDDDYETIESVDKVRIDSVAIVNDTMDVYSVQSIRTYSGYASGCQGFYGYDYTHNGNFGRDVTSYQYNTNGICQQATHKSANQFNFSPQQVGVYTFRFWKSDNSWITRTIVVE